MRQVYLDHQSAAPVLKEAMEAMRPYFAESFGNPSSLHQNGVKAREALNRARAQLAALVHADAPEEIIFTSDGTESANLAIKGVAYANERRGNHIILSATEHPAVMQSVEFLEKRGFKATRVGVDREGFISPDDIKAALTTKTILIAVHLVNYDVGTIQPLQEIGRMAGEAGVTLFADADGAAGWLPTNVKELGVDLLSFSANRFYGPKGVGVLYRNRRARMLPLLHGGTQENGLRAGLENIPAIVGAGVAAEVALREGPSWSDHCRSLQKQFWSGLNARIERIHLNGPKPGPKRIATNLNISAEGIESESQVLLCDMNGIAIAGATNCVSQSLRLSPVLGALGLSHDLAAAAIILSLGKDNTAAEMDYTTKALVKIIDKLRGMSPAWLEARPAG
jgi:cysteine desulfurase